LRTPRGVQAGADHPFVLLDANLDAERLAKVVSEALAIALGVKEPHRKGVRQTYPLHARGTHQTRTPPHSVSMPSARLNMIGVAVVVPDWPSSHGTAEETAIVLVDGCTGAC
jgi:hypothetical protein